VQQMLGMKDETATACTSKTPGCGKSLAIEAQNRSRMLLRLQWNTLNVQQSSLLPNAELEIALIFPLLL